MSYFLTANINDEYIIQANKLLDNPRWELDNDVLMELGKYKLFAETTKAEFQYQTHDKYDTDEALESLQTLFQVLQSFKDRVLDIRLRYIPNKKKLIKLSEDIDAYIYKNHYDDLKEFKNQGEKSSMIRGLTPKLNSLLNDYDTILEIATLVASNLTDTHYCLCQVESLAKVVNTNRQQGKRVL